MKTHTRPDGGAVIEMSSEEFDNLTILIGYACGAARDRDEFLFWSFLQLANEIHTGRPGWRPYEIPEEHRQEATTPSPTIAEMCGMLPPEADIFPDPEPKP
jgi:hypothetical protein